VVLKFLKPTLQVQEVMQTDILIGKIQGNKLNNKLLKNRLTQEIGQQLKKKIFEENKRNKRKNNYC
tara:strand:- start:3512 stop:3709 length:198 start_codon:yes stop_codon:yes gene_type:complete